MERGQGTAFAADGHIALDGSLPIASFGGLKARGHPVGASGVYQAVEMHWQLTGRAGRNQIQKKRGLQVREEKHKGVEASEQTSPSRCRQLLPA